MIAPGWIVFVELAAALLAATLVLLWWKARSRRRRERRARLARRFSEAEAAILDRDFPRWRDLPESLRQGHAGITRVLAEEKSYEACGGLPEVTDEMKLVIAAQAAMTILGKTDHGFFPRLKSILVYPGAFRDHGRRDFDLRQEDRGVLYGESWETGSVVLSWDNVLAGGRGADDGMNVVMHEFAHQLDQYNGLADGLPSLRGREAYARWSEVMTRHYELLKAEIEEKGRDAPFLDPYAATHPAEFFAVATESFFEDPRNLEEEHPELYDELAKFYGVDPADWGEPAPLTES